MTVTATGHYYVMVQTWIAYLTATAASAVTKLDAKVTVRSTTDITFLPLFFEHFKGDFSSFQGFWANGGGGLKSALCNNGAYGTSSTIFTVTNWTVDHVFELQCAKDQSQTTFLIDGTVAVSISSPSVSAQPFDILCGEVEGGTGTVYAKFPPGIQLP